MKQAACKMKPKKGDVSESYTSDAILNAPDLLFDLLAAVFRSWLVHGTVTLSLLACAFLPLLKNSLKNPADVKSYRSSIWIQGWLQHYPVLLVCYGNCLLLHQKEDPSHCHLAGLHHGF